MKRFIVVLVLAASGCASDARLQTSDVDRSKGTVELSLLRGQLEYSTVTPYSGLDEATLACKSMGFTSARPIGPVTTTCNVDVPSNCPQYRMSARYQCLK